MKDDWQARQIYEDDLIRGIEAAWNEDKVVTLAIYGVLEEYRKIDPVNWFDTACAVFTPEKVADYLKWDEEQKLNDFPYYGA